LTDAVHLRDRESNPVTSGGGQQLQAGCSGLALIPPAGQSRQGSDPLADPGWTRVLAAAGIGSATRDWLARLARRNGTTLHEELLASANIDRNRYFRAIAAEIGV